MSLVNMTSYAAQDVVLPDRQGRDMVVAIVKATFDIKPSGAVVPAEVPSPIRLGAECHQQQEPRSSIKFPSEACVEKLGTDVVLIGEAISAKPVETMDVAVKVRDVVAPLRVFGERRYYRSVFKVSIGPAAPFVRMPIVYERAYGGATDDYQVIDTRNPSGVGVAHSASDLVDTPAPQIEHPARPHQHVDDRHQPMGYGAIWSHWTPRLEYAGTMDEAWQQTRMPIAPLDYDIRTNNVAHPSLLFEQHLKPGDAISVSGMTESGFLGFALPDLPVTLVGRFEQTGRVAMNPPIDTVLLLPDQARLEMVARQAFPVGRAIDVLREIRIEPRA